MILISFAFVSAEIQICTFGTEEECIIYSPSCLWFVNSGSCSAYNNDQSTCEWYDCTFTQTGTQSCSIYLTEEECNPYSSVGCGWDEDECVGEIILGDCEGTYDASMCGGEYEPDITPPYFVQYNDGLFISIQYDIPPETYEFCAVDDGVGIESIYTNPYCAEHFQYSEGDENCLLVTPFNQDLGTVSCDVCASDVVENEHCSSFDFETTINTESCGYEIRDSDSVFYNVLTSPQPTGTTIYIYSECGTDNPPFYINGEFYLLETPYILDSGVYNFTIIRTDTTNYENFYFEDTFEILQEGVENPQGISKFWLFDKLSPTGETVSENGKVKIGFWQMFSNFFQNILNWIKGWFN